MHLPPFLFATAIALFWSASGMAQQAAPRAMMNVTPLRLELPSGQTSTQMLVRNEGKTPLTIQLRAFDWAQVDGEDRYQQSDLIAVSPSIVRIEPGQAQSFHVLSKGARTLGAEGHYRIVIDELPGTSGDTSGIAQTRLRLTLPLFTDSDLARAEAPVFHTNANRLVIDNPGGRAIRLTGIELRAGDRRIDLGERAALQYILGGSSAVFDLPPGAGCSGAPLNVYAMSGETAIDAVAKQDCP